MLGILSLFLNPWTMGVFGVIVVAAVLIGLAGGWPFVLRELLDWKAWVIVVILLVGVTLWNDQRTINADILAARDQKNTALAAHDGQTVAIQAGNEKAGRAAQAGRIQHVIDTARPGEVLDDLIDQLQREDHPEIIIPPTANLTPVSGPAKVLP